MALVYFDQADMIGGKKDITFYYNIWLVLVSSIKATQKGKKSNIFFIQWPYRWWIFSTRVLVFSTRPPGFLLPHLIVWKQLLQTRNKFNLALCHCDFFFVVFFPFSLELTLKSCVTTKKKLNINISAVSTGVVYRSFVVDTDLILHHNPISVFQDSEVRRRRDSWQPSTATVGGTELRSVYKFYAIKN